MPLYEYQCDACGERFEVIQKFSDAPLDICTECGKGPVHRLLSSPAIQFKGSGWYITDYARKGKADAAQKGKSESGDAGAGKAAADTKATSPAPSASPDSTSTATSTKPSKQD
jgi:putative FmdB family regulatory protein